MGIDVHLYHYSHDHDSNDFVRVAEHHHGSFSENYSGLEGEYATIELFPEAWPPHNMIHWQLRPEVLESRLQKALEATRRRYLEAEAVELEERENTIKQFIARYKQEYDDGYDPFVTVSY